MRGGNLTGLWPVKLVEMNPLRDDLKRIDASDIEHIGSLVAGGLLLLTGWKRGGALGALYKLGGVALIYRGQQGYKKLYDALGIPFKALPTGVGRFNLRAEAEVVVDRPREELYRIWRNLSNLPVFMRHLIAVEELDENRSRWTAEAPAGTVIEWHAEVINEVENELIAWRSLEGSGVDNAGSVAFEDAPEGTRIKVIFRYDPPAEGFGALIAKALGNDPQTQIQQDLEHFKAIMEIGGRPSTALAVA